MIFNESKLQEEIIKTWGEFGSHNEVFKAMTLQIKELKEQLILYGVGCSLPIKKEIVFSDSLKVEIETIDSNLKVLRAVNGWGYAIDKADIYINEK